MNRKHALVFLTAAVWLTMGAPMASGADKKLVGKKVMLRTPVDPTQNRFTFISTDPTIIFGAPNDSDTPTSNGASVLVFNPVSGECQCIQMGAARWSIGPDGKRYTYHDQATSFGPVKLAFIRTGKLKVVAKGALLTGITLNETTQGEIAVHYKSGDSTTRFCSHFAGGSVRVDRVNAFIGSDSAPQGVCADDSVAVGCTPCDPIP
jgi:hypothetical protein